MSRPARKDADPSWTTPLRRGGDQFEETTFPAASSDRADITTSQPADLARKASSRLLKLIRTIVRHRPGAWQKSFVGPLPRDRAVKRGVRGGEKLAEVHFARRERG